MNIDKNIKSKPFVYLAGPNVFYPDPMAEGVRKRRIIENAGMFAYYPMDNTVEDFVPNRKTARLIGRLNEEMLSKSQIIIANMEMWHGPSMDVGTAFEVGYMSRRANEIPHNVLIVGYYEHGETKLFAERVINDIYQGKVTKDSNGMLIGDDGMIIEDFGLEENIMIINAIEKTGGKTCQSFEEAVEVARNLYFNI